MRKYPAALSLLISACGHSRQALLPALDASPPGAAQHSICVDPRIELTGYWARTSLGPELARALKDELSTGLGRAGYEVSCNQPELIVRATLDAGGSTSNLESFTTLEVVHGARSIERVELRTPEAGSYLKAELYPRYAAVRLTNALSASLALAELTRAPPPPRPERAKQAAPAPPVVASFDVYDASGELDAAAQDQLSEYVAVRVTQSMGVRVLPRVELRQRLSLEKLHSYGSCVEEHCQIELGKALAAEKVLTTKLIRLGGTCALTGTLFDLRTETAELAASVKTRCGRDALLGGVDELVEALRKQQPPRGAALSTGLADSYSSTASP